LVALAVAAWLAFTSGVSVGVCHVLLFVLIAQSWRCGRATVRWRSRLFGELFIEATSLHGEGDAAMHWKTKEKKRTAKPSPKAIARVSEPDASENTAAEACDRRALGLVDTEAKACVCPVCGSHMEKRSAHKGGKFWGCSRWPLCDATRKFSDPYTWNVGPKNRAIQSRIEPLGTAS
jgi:hypothetical protein